MILLIIFLWALNTGHPWIAILLGLRFFLDVKE